MKINISDETLNKLSEVTMGDVQSIGHLLRTKTEGNFEELSRANKAFMIMSQVVLEVGKDVGNKREQKNNDN